MKKYFLIILFFDLFSCRDRIHTISYRKKGGVKSPSEDKKDISKVSTDPKAKDHRVILIQDSGFDIHHPIFMDKENNESKILAIFQKKCSSDVNKDKDKSLSFEEKKNKILAELKTKDTTCDLVESSEKKTEQNLNPEMLALRDQWNLAVREKKIKEIFTSPEERRKINVLLNSTSNESHGLATSSLIAYNNSSVRFVFLDLDISNSKSLAQETECLQAESLKEELKIYRQPEVEKAFIEQPLSLFHEKLIEIIKKYNITIENLSFGKPGRLFMENIYKQKGCPINLQERYQLLSSLEQKRNTFLREQIKKSTEKDILTIQAADNFQGSLDSPSDSIDCFADGVPHLFIGSYDITGHRSDFSSFGKCVDAFSLGESLIVASPNSFLSIREGTSYAAPLIT